MKISALTSVLLASFMLSSPILAADSKQVQVSDVFSSINEDGAVISLSDEEKAATGAAWLYYKDNPFFGRSGTVVKKVYVSNCKFPTLALSLGFNKTYVGCSN